MTPWPELQELKEEWKEKKQIEEGLLKKELDLGTGFAGGGIAGLSGGIDQGPQRRSLNPDSQGLRSLIKNGRKL